MLKEYYTKHMKHNIRRNAIMVGYHVKFRLKLSAEEIEEIQRYLREDFPDSEFEVKQARKYLHITNPTLKEIYSYKEADSDIFPDTRKCYWGKGYHVGGGAYCDDDGDNWDFW